MAEKDIDAQIRSIQRKLEILSFYAENATCTSGLADELDEIFEALDVIRKELREGQTTAEEAA
jgi:hypothetical protein